MMIRQSQKFLSFAYASGALQFGKFVLNSGRTSPYFLNTGGFASGDNLTALSEFYASTIAMHFTTDFMLYGPAYKGIPLVAATAMSLHRNHGCSVSFAFNRKEAKDHGELGSVVGGPLIGDVVIVEDVITSGLSIDKAVEIIRAQGANPTAVVICLDRMEKASDVDVSAVELVQQKHAVKVLSIATFHDLVVFVDNVTELREFALQIQEYGTDYVVIA